MARQITIGPHVVAVFDLVGQEAANRSLGSVIASNEGREATLLGIRETYGRVMDFRRMFTSQFRYQQSAARAAIEREVPSTLRAKARRLLQSTVQTSSFSDTVIAYSGVRIVDGLASPSPAWRVLGASAFMQLAFLAGGVPFRGGVEYGSAIRSKDVGLYGPALGAAHHLECRIAKFPRVVVGQKIIEKLVVQRDRASEDIHAKVARQVARDCLSVVTKWVDGIWMLDVVKYVEFWNQSDPEFGKVLQPLLDAARSFAKSERLKWRKMGHPKHFAYYDHLYAALTSRRPLVSLKSVGSH